MSRDICEIIKNMPWWARLQPVAWLLGQAFNEGWLVARVEFQRQRKTEGDVLRSAIRDLVEASEPMVGDKPATPLDYVGLHDAWKRALRALEAAS
jgi:hypothetical protein